MRCLPLVLLLLPTLLLGSAAQSSGVEALGVEFAVNSGTAGAQVNPGVAIGASGDFFVAWVDDPLTGSDEAIEARAFGADGSAVGEDGVVGSAAHRSASPSIAAGPTDQFTLVWTGDDGGETFSYGIQGRRFTASGEPLSLEWTINSYTSGTQNNPNVAGGPNGEIIVVWTDNTELDGSSKGVRAQRIDSNGVVAGAEFAVNSFTSGSQAQADVAVAPTGAFVVTWTAHGPSDGSYSAIQSQRFASNGNRLGNSFQVNVYTTGRQRDSAIAASGSGNFLVAWSNYPVQSGSTIGIRGRILAADGEPAGAEFTVNSYTTEVQRLPDVTALSTGEFVVVWEDRSEQDGSLFSVQAQRFSSNASRRHGEFRVNEITNRSQWRPAIAAGPDSSFIVVWEDDSGVDSPTFGVRARKFHVPTPFFSDGFEDGDTCEWSATFPSLC